MYSIQLTHPFGLMISGATETRKTAFVKQLFVNASVMIEPPPENYQNTFREIEVALTPIREIYTLLTI